VRDDAEYMFPRLDRVTEGITPMASKPSAAHRTPWPSSIKISAIASNEEVIIDDEDGLGTRWFTRGMEVFRPARGSRGWKVGPVQQRAQVAELAYFQGTLGSASSFRAVSRPRTWRRGPMGSDKGSEVGRPDSNGVDDPNVGEGAVPA